MKIQIRLACMVFLLASSVKPAELKAFPSASTARGTVVAFASGTDNSTGSSSYMPNELLITIRGHHDTAMKGWSTRTANPLLDSILESIGALKVKRVGASRSEGVPVGKMQGESSPEIYRVVLPEGTSLADAITRIPPHEEIVAVEPNFIYMCFDVPNDSFYVDQWAMPKVNAPQAWTVEKGDSNVVIGIIDTGVDYNHQDLAANIWINQIEYNGTSGFDDDGNGYIDDFYGYDFVTATSVAPGEDPGPPDNDPMDFHGHGTHVSGIAAAVGNNACGIAGMSWKSKLMAIRAGYKDTYGNGVLLISDIINAVYYAIDNGADVVSMSFGGGESTALSVALDDAYQAGIVLVAAAGNSGSNGKSYPAALPYVIAVAATDSLDQRASWSNFGAWVDVAAPGVDILSTMFDDTYATWSGTSMATPLVSGLAALALARHPGFTVDQVATAIRSGCDPIAPDKFIGIGRVNAARTVGMNSIAVAKLDQKYTMKILGPDNITITGTAGGASYSLFWGEGEYPASWNNIGSGGTVINGALTNFDASVFPYSGTYCIRLEVTDAWGQVSEDRWVFHYDGMLQRGWPKQIGNDWGMSVVVADLDRDGTNEIIACSLDGWVHVWDHTGMEMPGWPVKLSGSGVMTSTPACADLDLDNDMEIILASITAGIYAWHHDGSAVTGWPKTFPWPQRPWASVSIGNLDSDPEPEVVGSAIDPLALYVWNSDGSVVPGWPVTYPDGWASMSTPALIDIEGDGIDEIVFQRWWTQAPNQTAIDLLDASGNNLPGWPVFIDGGGYSSPTVCDLNDDGEFEIIASAGTQTSILDTTGQMIAGWPINYPSSADCASPTVGELDGDTPFEIGMSTICNEQYMFNHDSSLLPGWPLNPYHVCVITNVLLPSPIIGDANGDSLNDVIITPIVGNEILAYNRNGIILPDFPRYIGGYGQYGVLFATPSMEDTDGDGDAELLCPGADGFLYVWDLPSPFIRTDNGWYSVHHDLHNSRYLPRKQVQITQPNGGQILDAGNTVTIEWKTLAPHTVLNWDLWYSITGANGPWMEIAMDLPAGADTTGSIHSYDWIVPDTSSSQVRVKVTMDNAGMDYEDVSDADLEIRSGTAVQLSYFYAERRGGEAHLFWEIIYAKGFKGFHIYRQVGKEALEQITAKLITGGLRYEFVDHSPSEGEARYWLKEIETDYSEHWYGPAVLPASGPLRLAIGTIHPNPFNPSTTIQYTLPKAGRVKLAIYDVQGRPIKTLLNETKIEGTKEIDWDGRDAYGKDVSSGVYFVRLEFGKQVRSRKLVLVR